MHPSKAIPRVQIDNQRKRRNCVYDQPPRNGLVLSGSSVSRLFWTDYSLYMNSVLALLRMSLCHPLTRSCGARRCQGMPRSQQQDSRRREDSPALGVHDERGAPQELRSVGVARSTSLLVVTSTACPTCPSPRTSTFPSTAGLAGPSPLPLPFRIVCVS